MKKANIIFIVIAVAAVAALAVYAYMRRRRDQQYINTYSSIATDSTSIAATTSKGLNLNLILKPGSTGNEVVALQKMLLAFSPSLSVTGNFDEMTRSALKTRTGKSTTSLYEFRYMYFVPKYGEAAAIELFKAVTGQ